jgi:hypothetical protein
VLILLLLYLPSFVRLIIIIIQFHPSDSSNTNLHFRFLTILSTKVSIIDLQWSLCSPHSVATDCTFTITDVTTGECVRRIQAHREIINAVDRSLAAGGGMGTELVATASDDKTGMQARTRVKPPLLRSSSHGSALERGWDELVRRRVG